MGFPTVYYCVILPTPLVVVLQILDLIRVSLSTALGFVGVRCPLLELAALPAPPPQLVVPDEADRLFPVLSDVIPAVLPAPSSIKLRLPVVRFAALRRASVGEPDPAFCPICLCGLEARHQVRLLDNCRHVFHKGCLDRWVDQGQSTCPLCRSRLLSKRRQPGERRDQDDDVRLADCVDDSSYC